MLESLSSDPLKRACKIIDCALETLKKVLGKSDSEVLSSELETYALKGSALSLVQGFLDLANYLSAIKEYHPLNYSDMILYLIQNDIVDKEYEKLAIKLVDLRNKLLFVNSGESVGDLLNFLRENLKRIEELCNSLIRACLS
ncbi:MAG: HepT-like ribonuclease domain-containing protein [Candidatus Korarchaeota archaeon]|nr:DUF86 domain-containing protein [Thermoproteota archaeon]MCR8462955.1 DUF86 domain-containing protein [Thermoproteota archaeon]MCR8471130.1 DUF86 domain-containing protein [Thermoproteota archaeon]MCR8471421.1 DUF86 domain-containing protein [Thermoproteota archaeon]MCR8473165.1 DUF86 domain-containing protein [Thermoproteota archaeon]